MDGRLPSDSTLQALVDDIVKLGHANAGAFSLVLLLPVGARPAAVFEPQDFAASLESCGFFSTHMVFTLQRLVRADYRFLATCVAALMELCSCTNGAQQPCYVYCVSSERWRFVHWQQRQKCEYV
jgi:hypothetical protein